MRSPLVDEPFIQCPSTSFVSARFEKVSTIFFSAMRSANSRCMLLPSSAAAVSIEPTIRTTANKNLVKKMLGVSPSEYRNKLDKRRNTNYEL